MKTKELDDVITQLEKKRDEESGSVMKKLEEKLSETKKKEALAQSAVDNMKEGLKAENKRKKELTKNSTDVSRLVFIVVIPPQQTPISLFIRITLSQCLSKCLESATP